MIAFETVSYSALHFLPSVLQNIQDAAPSESSSLARNSIICYGVSHLS
jgi:hypothetical protein